MKLILTAALLVAFLQDDDLPVAADAPEAYRVAMERGKAELKRKRWSDAAQAFGDALRQKKNDKSAELGFGRAIREMEIYNTRFGELKAKTIEKFGMKDAVPAIERGLKWLASQQQEDGSWTSTRQWCTDDRATTAFALLALLADGNSEATGTHQATVAKGIAWLLKQQQPDGSFGGARLYTEGLCTLAIVEAFVMGGTSSHYEAAQKGINHIVKSQRPKGGWNYRGNEEGAGDTSVTGMMFQPLKQGQMAYLDFDTEGLTRGRAFVDLMTFADDHVAYREGEGRRKIAITTIGNLVRVYSGLGFDDAKVKAGLQLVLKDRAHMESNIYFLYYGAMLTFLAGGDAWQTWRGLMLPHLLAKQVKEGLEEGAWRPEGRDIDSGFQEYLSNVDVTAMSLLSLQACYRYVPANMLR